MTEIRYPPELPIVQRLSEIQATIAAHQVVVLCGETGSGKSTQLPKLCLDIGRGRRRLIGHTQPRRIAARSVAARVATELGQELGRLVGYRVRFTDRVGDQTRIKLMTDGILLNEVQHDRSLRAYDTLIIDEAHERSLNIDFLLGYLRDLLPRRPDLKLIVTSATIDPERFSAHFGGAPIIEVSGRTYPVEVRYRPPHEQARGDRDEGMQQGIADAVDELWREGPGDILVFLSGEREIRDTAETLRRQHRAGAEILPLYARLSAAEQGRIFRPAAGRRIVLATNVAETSLTVPGIRYVIDTGYARISRFSHRSKIQRLPVEPISRASADQRAGRCGRIADGICIRLYNEADHAARHRFTEPEILRTNLAAVILQMQLLGFGDIAAFPFVEPPERRQIKDGYRVLFEIGAVDGQRRITRLGRQLAQLPVDPRLGRMLLEAAQTGCLREVLVVVAALAAQDPRERPMERQQQADEAHAHFADQSSDFVAMLNLWQALETARSAQSKRRFRDFCRERFLGWTRVQEWYDVHRQLRTQMQSLGYQENRQAADYRTLHSAILSGLLSHIGFRQRGRDRDYLGARNSRFFVFPGSGLFKQQPKWLMAAELVETSKLYGRVLARIEPGWVERLAAHLVKRSYSEPHWQAGRGQVGAFETVTLYGITLVARRRVNFGPIDPPGARDIFIRAALVDGDFETRAPFWRHNRQLIDDIRALEAKSRRHDILVDDEAIYAFYDHRVPAGIHAKPAFEKWLREATRTDKYLLHLSRQDLLQRTPEDVSDDAFPDSLEVNSMRLPLDYRFALGEPDDGITLKVPASVLGQVATGRVDWLVPGMLREKVIALIKGLPKSLRRNFVPAPDFADRCLRMIEPSETPLVQVLGAALKQLTGIHVPEHAWSEESLPDHLKLRIAVYDGNGQLINASREPGELLRQLDTLPQAPAAVGGHGPWHQDDLHDWSCGDLPHSVASRQAGIDMIGYPALMDNAGRVDLRILDSAPAAAASHRRGVRRLIMRRLRAQLRDIHRGLRDIDQLRLQFVAAARDSAGNSAQSPSDIADDLVQLIIDQAFLAGRPEVRSRAAFEHCLADGRGRIGVVANQVTGLARQVLNAAQRLRSALADAGQARWQPAVRDIGRQLDELFYAGFLLDVPYQQLQHYPRYLQGMQLRLDKLEFHIERDQRTLEQMAGVLTAYRDAVVSARQRGVVDPRLDEIRWMLEELRIALFAQELKAAYKVSVKRLQKRWRELGF